MLKSILGFFVAGVLLVPQAQALKLQFLPKRQKYPEFFMKGVKSLDCPVEGQREGKGRMKFSTRNGGKSYSLTFVQDGKSSQILSGLSCSPDPQHQRNFKCLLDRADRPALYISVVNHYVYRGENDSSSDHILVFNPDPVQQDKSVLEIHRRNLISVRGFASKCSIQRLE